MGILHGINQSTNHILFAKMKSYTQLLFFNGRLPEKLQSSSCWSPIVTSCAGGDTICPAPVLPQWAPMRLTPPSRPKHSTLTAATACRLNMAVNKAAW